MMPGLPFKQINNVLLAVIIAVNLVLIATPLVPVVSYWASRHSGRFASLNGELRAPPLTANNGVNRLIIPAMLFDQPIAEGPDMSALSRGPWRWPSGSTPDKGGNTVIAGHRFTYTNPRGIFYYLNKLKVGDQIGIIWRNQLYLYIVSRTETVPPSRTDVVAPTAQPQLTLYTCTPLWWPKNRLVVVARLEKII